MTFRNSENKDVAKFREESYIHVNGFFKTLREIERLNPRIISDGERIWNMDETKVIVDLGNVLRCLDHLTLTMEDLLHLRRVVDRERTLPLL